ncbi:metallopeptidase TldD-related protein [Thiothrix nivea]|uniref:Metalloprotease TldD/E C-terminal domain-containing protein n=1 Tax=Thiothrix nivea (strain ATCC 35100 / DSM 5205 / JP2) TaxID=870187 RepID=A0A656HCD1_THINJ|nr:metallopeptidase TldD-related protein [Thiothrix nivea]EIJ34811.1 hypothetical protein Thini_2252 [Thiothrix nivea DSM 5205]
MQNYFRELSEKIFALLKPHEALLLNFAGEQSDFVRLNKNRIRQAGHVAQQTLAMTLIADQRQNGASFDLAVALETDVAFAGAMLVQLRQQLPFLPEDPYLNYATAIHNTHDVAENRLPVADAALEEVMAAAKGLDLVGLWASGEVSRGFANSLGQFNWHVNYNFNVDWSIYSQEDKAIKQNHAGFQWDAEHVRKELDYARQTLPLLAKPPRSIRPGNYRVFITPSAMQELTNLLSWGGFSLKSHRTAQTPLLKMIEAGMTLNPKVSLIENHRAGLTPRFTDAGFIKPDQVTLIEHGVYKQCLADSRSAKEYGLPVNCDSEAPQSLHISGGGLQRDNILPELGTGIFISNLWYCNYSDRNHCRMTGMTRFASLWVESGVPVAPLSVMRFDESLYHIFGDKLMALTAEPEALFDASSYGGRSQASSRLPGALVDDFRLTL